MRNLRQSARAYTVAVLSVGVGIALPLVSKPFIGQSAPYLSFIPAVLLSAWYGGFVPGLVTSGLLLISTLVLNDILFTATTITASRVFGAFMFVVAALSVCLVIRALRRAQAAALEAAGAALAAEARAQDERDRLDVILRDLPVGVLIADREREAPDTTTGTFRVELANPAAMKILGTPVWPGDDFDAHRPESFRGSDGNVSGSGDWPIERSLRYGETIVNEEIDIIAPDGSPRTLMVNSRPLQGSAGQSAAIATYSDVTSLRAAQQALRDSEVRLRRLFNSPIIGVVSGRDDVATEANEGFLRMLGYSRADLEAGTIRFSTMTPPEFQATDVRITQQLVEHGFSGPVSKELLAADGRRVPVMLGATTFEAGKASPWIAWVLDLSEHRKLEERVRQAAKAESVGLLAGGVAHDFNNLLTIITGNATLAREALPAGALGRVQLDNALRASERAIDLTRQLLAYAGKGQFVVRPADLSAVIHDIGRLFRASAPKQIDVRLELATGLPPINADATQIQQLAMNLVINAVESIGDRNGSVCVKTDIVDLDEHFLRSADLLTEIVPGRHVRIEVRDDGCGMDAETRGKIFDPFFTTKFTGRGLGLAAAAGIVRAHHGGMVVHSNPGHGSQFEIFLPVAVPTAAPAITTPVTGPAVVAPAVAR